MANLNHRQEKIESLLARLVGEFLSHEAGPVSLITVTHVTYNEKTNHASVFITVLPETQEETALAFAKRRSSDLRDYVKDHVKMRAIPIFVFFIDIGEKNRQMIENISVKDSMRGGDDVARDNNTNNS